MTPEFDSHFVLIFRVISHDLTLKFIRLIIHCVNKTRYELFGVSSQLKASSLQCYNSPFKATRLSIFALHSSKISVATMRISLQSLIMSSLVV